MTTLKNSLKKDLPESDMTQRRSWAEAILASEKSIDLYLDLLLVEGKVSMRFSWLLGDLSSIDNRYCKKIIQFGMMHVDAIQIPDFPRVLAKQYCLLEEKLDEEVESKLLSYLFGTLHANLLGPHAMNQIVLAVLKIGERYPEVKRELQELLKLRSELGHKLSNRVKEQVHM